MGDPDRIARGQAREHLLKAARTLIAEEGVDKLTHRAVSERAAVSPGTVTYHFRTRDDLARAAFASYADDYERELRQAMSRRPLRSLEDLVGFLAVITLHAPAGPGFQAIEFDMALWAVRDPEVAADLGRMHRALEAVLADALEALGAGPPIEGARRLIALCRGTEYEVIARAEPLAPDAFRARITAMVEALSLRPAAS